MTGNSKTCIIITMLLLLALYNNSQAVIEAQAMQQQTQSLQQQTQVMQVHQKIDYKKLDQDPNWQALSKLWKQCNHFEEKMANKTLDEKREEFSHLNSGFYKYLDPLKQSHLLTEEQANYLNYIIHNRLSFIEREFTLMMCRRMLPPVNVEKNLEKRFDTLERLSKEGKINTKAYTVAKQNLKEDLIQLQRFDRKPHLDENNINLLLYLNK